MSKKEEKKEKAAEVKMPESSVEAETSVQGKKVKVKVPPVNELVFRKGDEVKLKDLPFKVVEVRGLDLVVRRKDIK